MHRTQPTKTKSENLEQKQIDNFLLPSLRSLSQTSAIAERISAEQPQRRRLHQQAEKQAEKRRKQRAK
jgi:hypothetical protein